MSDPKIHVETNNSDRHTNGKNRERPVCESNHKISRPNPFQLGPALKFQPHLIREKCEELVRDGFAERGYDHDVCRSISENVRGNILAMLKTMFDRYRFVVNIAVGGKTGQSVKIVSRALWDADVDNYITINYENRDLYTVATVFAIYFE
ncbi:dynein light chain Tctex-type protein 2 [Myxocyprinus asiaticus]|uniref:dynein light chain Tctex-type protein 2 n=1 Tax=Myxocyprinus asiaticus TaxID=70543 RepID=UPI00222270CF|nr:dynein light chain Tctex-type protein 2 [Myxocyprinus asiaticus]